MKIINAKYIKEDGQRDVRLYQLNETPQFIEGVDLTKLNLEEQKELKNVIDEYWLKMKPFISKSYRRFSKVNFLISGVEEI